MFATRFKSSHDYYKIDLDNPAPGLREDLRLIRTAEKMGFVPKEGHNFDSPLSFTNPKTDMVIWHSGIGVNSWTCAILENGGYHSHRYFPTLLEALEAS